MFSQPGKRSLFAASVTAIVLAAAAVFGAPPGGGAAAAQSASVDQASGTQTPYAYLPVVERALPTPTATPVPPASWALVGSMSAARSDHTATLLTGGPDAGDVLVAGGDDVNGKALASAELYDQATKTWSPVGSLTAARAGHTATLLASGPDSGCVLVAGGDDVSDNALASAELYDPATKTWSPVGSLSTARAGHTATLLTSGSNSGDVLVAGGADSNDTALAGAELYDPATKTWSPARSLGTARYNHTATLLVSGKVLVAGGEDSEEEEVANAEQYDPTSNTWSPAGSLSTARFDHIAALLLSGQVLVAGGESGGFFAAIDSAELYDPASNTWSPTVGMTTARSHQTATLLASGQVLVAGGIDPNGNAFASAELYTP